jgi:hypothetical protein
LLWWFNFLACFFVWLPCLLAFRPNGRLYYPCDHDSRQAYMEKMLARKAESRARLLHRFHPHEPTPPPLPANMEDLLAYLEIDTSSSNYIWSAFLMVFSVFLTGFGIELFYLDVMPESRFIALLCCIFCAVVETILMLIFAK